ncbi:recombinase XerD [Kitasatospora sp. GP82]|uniref:recombinase XerD n=1 Tax=Kitasatospora sp. GP82 TaxID=3035089 RepID=UPI002473C71A|nr:recombinase XerD [Kitasatospora sp. GP82]MDH6128824.1 integrase [Kitasatospora sp. GP82]
MDYFFTSRDKVRRYPDVVDGVELDAVRYVTRDRAVTDGTPFFLGTDMRPLEPHCSFFREMAKTNKAKSLQDYAYDFLGLDDFLSSLDPPSDVLSATEDDLLAYREHCTKYRDEPMRPASWRRHRTTLNNFYNWAVETGLLERRPYLRKANGRDVLSGDAVAELAVRCLTYDQWWLLDRVGLRGLRPDGSVDPTFRSAHPLRNSCGGNLSITTGLRLREFRALLDVEVGAPRRDGTAAEVDLQAIAKFGLPRTVEVQDRVLREIDWYRKAERAGVVRKAAKNLWRRREELFVVSDVNHRQMKVSGVLHGRRRTFAISAMDAALRKITVFEADHGLEAMALFVGRPGLMVSNQRWEQVFASAHSRAQRLSAECETTVEMPRSVRIHDLRHTFAVYMLEMMTEILRAQDAEEFARSGRVPTYAADHQARNPFLTLMGLLGHRRPESTMRYLTYKKRTNLLVAQAVQAWNDQDRTFADLALQRSSGWGI